MQPEKCSVLTVMTIFKGILWPLDTSSSLEEVKEKSYGERQTGRIAAGEKRVHR